MIQVRSQTKPKGDDMKIQSAKLTANYGAGNPTLEGFIVEESFGSCTVKWNDGTSDMVMVKDIKPKGWKSANGSTIGILYA